MGPLTLSLWKGEPQRSVLLGERRLFALAGPGAKTSSDPDFGTAPRKYAWPASSLYCFKYQKLLPRSYACSKSTAPVIL
jgi:hypothetical protein